MLEIVDHAFKSLRSFVNITILLSALVVAPLFIAAQFFPYLQSFISEVAGKYIPHPTVTSTERKRRISAEADAKKRKRANDRLVQDNRKIDGRRKQLVADNRNLTTKHRTLDAEYNRVKTDSIRNSNATVGKVNRVSGRGQKIIRRGATALGVGWIPYAGGAYDLYSLKADFSDVCALLQTIDELSEFLHVDSSLYKQNYCDTPDKALDMFRDKS